MALLAITAAQETVALHRIVNAESEALLMIILRVQIAIIGASPRSLDADDLRFRELLWTRCQGHCCYRCLLTPEPPWLHLGDLMRTKLSDVRCSLLNHFLRTVEVLLRLRPTPPNNIVVFSARSWQRRVHGSKLLLVLVPRRVVNMHLLFRGGSRWVLLLVVDRKVVGFGRAASEVD